MRDVRARRSPGAVRAWAVLAIASVACDKSERPAPDAGPAQASASASAALGDASRPRAPRWGEAVSAAARLPCRAVAVNGDVRAEDVALPGSSHGKVGDDGGAGLRLAAQQELPAESWLGLAVSARLVAKDPRTTRETTFLGPAQVRPCVARREESWVSVGVFESVAGAGESPGSEEWLVTPVAVLRYASAKLHVVVGPKGTAVTSAGGLAFAWLAGDARARWGGDAGAGGGDGGRAGDTDGWERVAESPVTIEPVAPLVPLPGARAAVEQCAALADRSHELAMVLMAPSVGLPDASTAAEEVVAHRLARAACAVASLRVGTLPEAPAKDALAAKLQGAVAVWAALPSP
jgi:hypothetical protein